MDRLKLFLVIALVYIHPILASLHKPITEIPKIFIGDYPRDVSYRLPSVSYPKTYNIEMTWIDEENFTFNGRVIIENVIRNDTNTILIHKLQTNIEKVTLKELPNGQTVDATYEYSNVTDFLTIKNDKTMTKDSVYALDITYNGVLRSGNRGFFRQSYLSENGEKREEHFSIYGFNFYVYLQ